VSGDVAAFCDFETATSEIGILPASIRRPLIPLVETQIMRRQQAEARTTDFAKR
jgi:hypothetical protein